jgi:xylan 1,4-beta-xylosidase
MSITCSDRGDGTYANPVLYGEYPDPCIFTDDDGEYYMVNCCQPLMWHSKDLIHWEPLYEIAYSGMGGAAELCKFKDTYYIYNIDQFFRDKNDYKSNRVMVITTKDIKSPDWQGPFYVGPAFNLENDRELIDPGHVVDFEGRRWLYMSENICFPLTQDGLKFAGPGKRVLADEVIPDEWDVEGTYTEGPRFTKKDGWIYLTLAVGGTVGPPTSHSVFSYRSRNADGPWEPSPFNPIMRTYSHKEKWRSKGHGTLVQALNGAWHMPYHALLNGRENHGRMLMMEPVEWTAGGWYRIPEWSAADRALPLPQGGQAVRHGFPSSIVFPEKDALPGEWIYAGNIKERMREANEGLVIRGSGTNMHDTGGWMCFRSVYRNFEAIAHLTVAPGAGGGIGMYYSAQYSVGYALKDDAVWAFKCMHPNYTKRFISLQYLWDEVYLKMVVRDQVVCMWVSPDKKRWTKMLPSANISHISVYAELPREIPGMMMYPALFSYGTGEVVFHSFEMNEVNGEDE